MPFGLCNVLATFQRLMQNCMGELNLDNLIVFLQTAEEHLHHLCVVFDCLQEYNLKLKPLKCNLFSEEINYLAHKVSKAGIRPSDTNMKAIAEYTPPKTYTEIRVFIGLVRHYRRIIKGFAQIAPPLNEHLVGEGASRKSERVSLSKEALKAFEWLKQACMNSLVLAFADYTKVSCWKQMPRRKDWEQFSLRNRKMDGFTQWPMAARHFPCTRRIIILQNSSF